MSGLSDRESKFYNKRIKPHLNNIVEFRSKGYGIVQIAKAINVDFSTLYKYQEKVPELEEALETGKQALITNIENALWSKALGGLPIKKTTTTTYKKSGEEIVREEFEYSIPDNTAMIFALKSLVPEKYVEQKPNYDGYDEIDEPHSERLKREYEDGEQ